LELFVQRPPQEIVASVVPTLGPASFALLGLALAGAAIFLIRRV
jgi:hypothetical protein